ncbi:hypothetical protein E2C01_044412 [Portunus trituberculatus]|uniref:Uncharacterized protein n=1 Tax=Portunus trituberculatus TaxID=210409 RepID=A0A5B7FVJ3_PORTR|nr:hypothetical protein [Portunus trituberculatus]
MPVRSHTSPRATGRLGHPVSVQDLINERDTEDRRGRQRYRGCAGDVRGRPGCGVSAAPRVGSYRVGVPGGVLTLVAVHYPNETVAPGITGWGMKGGDKGDGKEGGNEKKGRACHGPLPSFYHFSPSSSSHTLSPLQAYGIGVEQTNP